MTKVTVMTAESLNELSRCLLIARKLRAFDYGALMDTVFSLPAIFGTLLVNDIMDKQLTRVCGLK